MKTKLILILTRLSQQLLVFLTPQKLTISGILQMGIQPKQIQPFNIPLIRDILMFYLLLITEGVLILYKLILSFTLTLRYQNLRQTKPYIVILEASL